MPECSTCADARLDDIEAAGSRVLAGEPGASWNALSKQFDLTRQSLRNHMEKHFVRELTATELVADEFDDLIADTVRDLMLQMSVAPPELKAMYAVAIANLKNINQTKPSQQNLVNALKAITEVTGMKMEQRLMLEFGKQMFGLQAEPAPLQIGEAFIEVESEEL